MKNIKFKAPLGMWLGNINPAKKLQKPLIQMKGLSIHNNMPIFGDRSSVLHHSLCMKGGGIIPLQAI